MIKVRIVWLFLVMTAISSLGCASRTSSGPETVQVSGVITLDGNPLGGADVYFQTDEFTGFGHTDAEGKFRLVQGAVVGVNKVYISKMDGGAMVNEDPESGMDLGQFQAAAEGNEADPAAGAVAGPKELIPDAYSNPSKSKLTFNVPEGGATNADFNL